MSAPRPPIERYDLSAFLAGDPRVSLRPLPPGEADRIAPLFAAMEPWVRLRYRPEALAAYLSTIEKGAPRYAIMADNDVAGAIGLRLNWLRGPYLQFLGILPRFQKHKLGSAVLAWLADEARRHGEANVWVCASQFNTDAIAFYEANGFVRTALLDDLVAPGTAEILLRRRL